MSSRTWRTSFATSTPRRTSSSRSVSTRPWRRAERNSSASRAALPPVTTRAGRCGGEIRAGVERHRRQEGLRRSTSGGARTSPARSRPGWPRSSSRRAPSRRAEDAVLRVQRATTRARSSPPFSRSASQARAGALPVHAAAIAAAPARRTGRRSHRPLPVPVLPPIGDRGGRRLDRAADFRGKQGQARLAGRLSRASLHAAADPRGADARPAHAARGGDCSSPTPSRTSIVDPAIPAGSFRRPSARRTPTPSRASGSTSPSGAGAVTSSARRVATTGRR